MGSLDERIKTIRRRDEAEVGAGYTGAPPALPGGDDPEYGFVRDDFLAGSSITIAALTIQRQVVSFVLQDITESQRKANAPPR
jgi:hypothetical protein